jgi:hypothetical protein
MMSGVMIVCSSINQRGNTPLFASVVESKTSPAFGVSTSYSVSHLLIGACAPVRKEI